ncbi:MAG: DUF4331 domain-containing protein [Deltaproteobacteria bacterium]|nr:DUF4331 domain-containing protein [Deltaproteobacteria bacterium]
MTSLLVATVLSPAFASSHREAPGISLDPSADITDFYMFNDPNDSSKVVFIMNVIPMELPGGGPNFYRFDDNVMYAINIDNEGDGEEDIVFQFQFATTFSDLDAFGLPTFLYNIGDVATRSNLYQQTTYSVTRVDDGVATTLGTGLEVAPINVGTQGGAGGYNPEGTSPGAITSAYVETSGSYSFFAGPRQEGFYVDLERTFDLLNVAGIDEGANTNTLLGYNVHSIAISVPKSMVTRDGAAPTAAAENHVISAWSTTSRRAISVRRANGVDSAARGEWVQVARLGNPLVNEAVIPTTMKDVFNASHPRDDIQFLSYVQDPALAYYMNLLLGTTDPSVLITDAESTYGLGLTGREDLIATFLTGNAALGHQASGWSLGGAIPGESGKTFAAYEALRINLEGTGFGQWPDGRGVKDDVVDVALSGVAGYLIYLDAGYYIQDGVDSTGLSYLDSFPYLGDPWAGDDHPAGYHDL